MPVILITGAALQRQDSRLAVSTADAVRHDTRLVTLTRGARRHDTRLLVNPAASFIHARGAAYFPWGPARPVRREVELFQVRDRSSDAALYVYGKGISGRALYRLSFPRVDPETLSALQTFVRSAARGVRSEFVWRDHAGVDRTVRLADARLRHRQTGPRRYAVEISLTEDLP